MLDLSDPLLRISNRVLLVIAVSLEIITLSSIGLSKRTSQRFLALMTLSLCLLSYRVFSFVLDSGPICPCLGSLGDFLGLDAATVSLVGLAILLYWLVPSIAFAVLTKYFRCSYAPDWIPVTIRKL